MRSEMVGNDRCSSGRRRYCRRDGGWDRALPGRARSSDAHALLPGAGRVTLPAVWLHLRARPRGPVRTVRLAVSAPACGRRWRSSRRGMALPCTSFRRARGWKSRAARSRCSRARNPGHRARLHTVSSPSAEQSSRSAEQTITSRRRRRPCIPARRDLTATRSRPRTAREASAVILTARWKCDRPLATRQGLPTRLALLRGARPTNVRCP